MLSKSYLSMNRLERLLFYTRIFKWEKLLSSRMCPNQLEGHYQSTIKEGLIVWSNSVFADFFGFKDFKETKRNFFISERYVDKNRREEFIDILMEKGKVNKFDSQFVRNDGSIFWMRLNSIIHIGKGITEGYAIDVTDIKNLQEKYEDIVQNSRDIICESRLSDGCFSMVSNSVKFVTGHNANDLVGKPVSDVYVFPEDRKELINELLSKGEIRNRKVECYDINGNEIFLSGNLVLIRDNDGSPYKIRSYFRDVTKLVALEKENEELNRVLANAEKMEALGLLAGGVAHDLNNVLSGVVSYPELLMMDMKEDDPLRSGIELIQRSGKRASEIVKDLLVIARKNIAQLSPLNLNTDIVNEYLSSSEFGSLQKNFPKVSIKNNLEGRIKTVNGSKSNLHRVLMNLMINVAESIDGKGEIVISTFNEVVDEPFGSIYRVERGEYSVLSVSDTGSGILDEDLPRIFEPFYTKKVLGRSGTGIGMSIIWGVLQSHKGFVDIQSRKEGQGSVFNLYFPVFEESQLEVVSGLEKSLQDDDSSRRVLVVDDLADQRMIASKILLRKGYLPKVAESGEEALSIIQSGYVPDLVILDMKMNSGIDGLDTYKGLRKLNVDVPVVIASGYSEGDRITEALRLGAKSLVSKPYSIKTLIDAIDDAFKS